MEIDEHPPSLDTAQRLLGFQWQPLQLPSVERNKERAIARFAKLFPELVFNIVHLEGNPFTFPEVQTLLEGITVGGHKIEDEQQVLNQRDSINLMLTHVRDGTFDYTKPLMCELHTLAAKGEALNAGHFRTSGVGIAGTSQWKAPKTKDLDNLFVESANALLLIPHPIERAIAAFLVGARTLFFSIGNKRTARLMMNGIILSEGTDAITVPAKKRNEFNQKMVRFYDSGDADEMMKFLVENQISARFE